MKKNRIILPSILLLVFTLCFTYVYASISTSMLISGEFIVKAPSTFISSVTYVSSTGNASYSTPVYTDTSFYLPVTLAPDESITFNVGVTNTSFDDYEVTLMNVDTYNLTYLYQGDTCFLGDRVADRTNNTCVVTLTNETSNTINATYITEYEYTLLEDYSLAHRLETLTSGVESGLVHDLADDTEYINRYAYIGTDPYNYVIINNELWRIMGLYFNITGGEEGEKRVKIVKDTPEVKSTWDDYNNDWDTSTLSASLESYYTSNLIESALWHYGSTNYNYNQSSTDELESQLMNETTAGNQSCGVLSWLTDNGCRNGTFSTHTTKTIGLLSPAEYAQTTGGGTLGREACLKSSLRDGEGWVGGTCNQDSWLFNSTKLTAVEWTIQPMYRSNYANYVAVINRQRLDRALVTSSYLVRPAAYLKANVEYVSGNGSRTNPYVVATSGSHHNHVVTFDANGGMGFMSNQIITNNTSTPLTPNTYTREGYTFLGWSTDKNAQLQEYRDGESVTLTGNLNLYAIWSARSTLYSEIKNLATNSTVSTFPGSDDAGGSNSIYYFSGSASNNNVIFGGVCWKIFRTTSTGGVKLIYNGTPSNNTCSSSPGISKSEFNSTTLPEGVGFMYDLGNLTNNTTDSDAKAILDSWVLSDFINYVYYLEDTPYCNDRSIHNTSPNSSYITNGEIRFNRYSISSANLTCANQRDRFTVSNSVGNSALTYPVGLITADELYLAGITGTSADTSNYLYTGEPYWTMTPKIFKLSGSNYENRLWRIDATTPVMDEAKSDSNNKYIRPVVTLNNSVILDSGNGSSNNPYVVLTPAVAPLTVTYNANGGTGTMNQTPISRGKGFILPTNTYTRTDYHFIGWAETSNGDVEYADGATVSFNSSITLYAIWEKNVQDYDYTGTYETFTPVNDGLYRLEVWGAQGGSYNSTYVGGYGAYATGVISIRAETTLYIVVGGAGTGNELGTLGTTLGGYNGGGNGNVVNNDVFSGSGGGASHIALINGELKTIEAYKDYNGILITAAGGSGAYGYNPSSGNWWSGVSGGGIAGGYNNNSSQAGSQTSGYAFGAGGDQTGATVANTNHAGGGGGWYGGFADYADNNNGGLGGGSSNISNYYLYTYGSVTKRMVGYNVTTSNNADTYTLSTTNHSATATENYAKEGNGHVRITYLGTQ